jgi:AbrB family looped-hinge helix DNA binding protein
MRISAKGQITIPIEIREQLGLLPDTEIEFEVIGGKALKIVKVAKSRTGRGRSIVSRLRGRLGKGLSTDEIMAMTRE